MSQPLLATRLGKKLSFSGDGGLQSIGPQVIIGLNRGEERLALGVLTDLAGSCKIP